MTDPLLSVVLPVRDAAATIERAARSILDSSLRQIELIVVDDGSTDGSTNVLGRIDDDRLRVVRQDALGVCAAANRGSAEATAPVIARMDADDFSHPTRLEKQLALLTRTGADLVGTQVQIVDEAGAPVGSMQRYQDWSNSLVEPARIRAHRFVELPIVNPTLMARRAVFEAGYRDGPWPEDYDFFLRAMGAGHTAAKVPEVLLDWQDSERRLTRTGARYRADAFDRCRREHLLAGPLAGCREVASWGAGDGGKPWMRWLLAQGFAVRHVVDVAPRKIGNLIHGVPVIAPADLPAPDGTPLIIAVGARGAREEIEQILVDRGYAAGVDAWFVC